MSEKEWRDMYLSDWYKDSPWKREIKIDWFGIDEAKTKDQPQMYEFNVSAAEQIDFSEIYKEISRQKPLFMVEYKGENGSKSYHVVIHDSLWTKAQLLEIMNPQDDEWITHSMSVELDHPSEFSDWKKWAKKVIEIPWNGEKGKVTVKELEL